MEYRISTNFSDTDFERIHRFISNSYWAKNIPSSILKKALNNSLCFSVIDSDDLLVGFARLITDKATFAYLADVFILPEHRGNKLSKTLIKTILSHPELQYLRRVVLATKDAHGLYEQFGFKSLAHPETFMEIWQPDIYATPNN